MQTLMASAAQAELQAQVVLQASRLEVAPLHRSAASHSVMVFTVQLQHLLYLAICIASSVQGSTHLCS